MNSVTAANVEGMKEAAEIAKWHVCWPEEQFGKCHCKFSIEAAIENVIKEKEGIRKRMRQLDPETGLRLVERLDPAQGINDSEGRYWVQCRMEDLLVGQTFRLDGDNDSVWVALKGPKLLPSGVWSIESIAVQSERVDHIRKQNL